MVRIFFKLNTLIGIVLLLASVNLTAQKELLDSAQIAYNSGDYAKALFFYQKIEETGIKHPLLYFNIGNTYHFIGELGKSILMYEKALKLQPNFKDAQYNLALVKKNLQDEFDELPIVSWKSVVNKLSALISPNTTAYFSLFTLIFLVIYRIYCRLKKIHSFWWINVLGILFIALSYGLSFLQIKAFEDLNEAIITTPIANVYSAPTQEGKLLFTIHEGTKVIVLETYGDQQMMVKAPNGFTGWLAQKNLGIID